jgi:hypothetical protein
MDRRIDITLHKSFCLKIVGVGTVRLLADGAKV